MRDVLLGQHFPGLFFGHSVVRFINHQFMAHDFTTAVLRKGLQVRAAAVLFQTVGLSFMHLRTATNVVVVKQARSSFALLGLRMITTV